MHTTSTVSPRRLRGRLEPALHPWGIGGFGAQDAFEQQQCLLPTLLQMQNSGYSQNHPGHLTQKHLESHVHTGKDPDWTVQLKADGTWHLSVFLLLLSPRPYPYS